MYYVRTYKISQSAVQKSSVPRITGTLFLSRLDACLFRMLHTQTSACSGPCCVLHATAKRVRSPPSFRLPCEIDFIERVFWQKKLPPFPPSTPPPPSPFHSRRVNYERCISAGGKKAKAAATTKANYVNKVRQNSGRNLARAESQKGHAQLLIRKKGAQIFTHTPRDRILDSRLYAYEML